MGYAATCLAASLAVTPAAAQVCAPPGAFQTGPTSGVVNTYYAAASGSTLNIGATSMTVGTASGYDPTNPVVGDLLLVIQMQDASLNTANNSSYGNGTGQGSTSVGNSGLHQFVRVTSAAGANVTFTPALQNSYTSADATASTFRKRYQVVRVRQYSTLAAAGITALPWNGSVGGVIAVDVLGALTLNNAPVVTGASAAFFAAGLGFRGALGRNIGTSSATRLFTDYASNEYHAGKGEGIAGTPRYFANLTNATTTWVARAAVPAITGVDLGSDALGYPGGSAAQGAPANAGGGGSDGANGTNSNSNNAGGGGGGNYGPGGVGGRPWDYPLVDSGGRGAAGYSGQLAFNRAFMGGGGGAGGTNNNSGTTTLAINDGAACSLAGVCSSGAPGGGIVIIRAASISGSGVIDVRGGHGYNVGSDAAGGGGAAGSVVLHTQSGGSATIYAQGGDGGNAWYGYSSSLGDRHGPGGGGGGGFVAYSPTSMAISALVSGGIPGRTTATDYYDANGYNGGLTTFQTPNTPGVPIAADCEPNLSLSKTNGGTSLTSPGTTTYTLAVLNSGNSATSGTVSIGDQLPAGLSVVTGALTLSGPHAGSWSCTASSTTAILCTSASTISSGATSSFAFPVAVLAANGTSLVNRARVTGGGDPNKPTPPDPVADAAACTANGSPAGCALDADTVLAPNLSLTKTNDVTTVLRGTTFTYALVATNGGGTGTAGTITVLDSLPTGLTYTSTPGGNGFSCSTSGVLMTCTRGTSLGAGASATITFVARALPDAPSSVTNLARIGGGGDPSPQKSTPVAGSVTACASPVPPATTSSDASTGCAADTDSVRYVSLSLTKDDGQPYMSAGGTISYTFVIRNTGTADTTGTISFMDVLPSPTLTFVNPLAMSGSDAADWSCTRTSGTVTSCVSSVSIPAGGSSSFILGVNVIAGATVGQQHTNRARVGGGGDVTPGSVANPATTDVAACVTDGSPAGCAIDFNTVQSAPQIRLAKSHADPQSRSPGDTVTFVLQVSNTGGSTAGVGTVQVIDVLPAGLTYVLASGTGFTCANTGQVVNCRNANSTTGTGGAAGTYQLAASTSRNINITATVAASATNDLLNVAKAAGSTDLQNSTPMSTSTANLAIVSACSAANIPYLGCAVDPVPLNADLQIVKLQRTGSGVAAPTLATPVPTGNTVQFVLTVSNAGPSRATAVQVIDTVPTNFTNVSWTCGGASGGASCGAVTSGTGNAVGFTTGVLPSGGSIRVTVTATATSATDINGVTNTASLTTPTGITDGTPTNNISSVTTRIGSANLGIAKANGGTTLAAGTTTTYTIVVTNTGDFPADGARLYDPAIPGLRCTQAPTCIANGAGTSCPASLTAGQLQNGTVPTGVEIPTFGPGGTLTLTYTCGVTATGL